jgi:hypothetical protein
MYEYPCMYINIDGDAPVPRSGRLASDSPPSESVSRPCAHSPASGNHDVHVQGILSQTSRRRPFRLPADVRIAPA